MKLSYIPFIIVMCICGHAKEDSLPDKLKGKVSVEEFANYCVVKNEHANHPKVRELRVRQQELMAQIRQLLEQQRQLELLIASQDTVGKNKALVEKVETLLNAP